MKKKTKITKTLALALTLGLLCSGLTGCGQAQNDASVSEGLATESAQTATIVESTAAESTETAATESAENTETADGMLVRVASLKGPTSLGLLFRNYGITSKVSHFYGIPVSRSMVTLSGLRILRCRLSVT